MAVFNNILAGASGQTGGAAAGYIIEKSLRFDKDASAYLNRTPSSDGNKKTWTYSTWLKLSDVVTATQNLINAGNNTTLGRAILRYSGQQFQFLASAVGGTTSATVYTNAVLRDPSAWYHLVFSVDTTQATDTDRIKMWINGVAQTFSVYTAPAQDGVFSINDNSLHKISGAVYTSGQYFNGYMADTILVDGQALAATDFGEFDDNNVWQPIEYAGTYGTNGFHLDFSDNSSASALGTDSSGNGNDWTPNNFSVTAGTGNDSLFDSPTNGTQADTGAGGEVSGGYATLNPLNSIDATLSNGNLDCSLGGTYKWGAASTIGVTSGKFYIEVKCVNAVHSNTQIGIGDNEHILKSQQSKAVGAAGQAVYYRSYEGNKRVYTNGSEASSSYGDTYTQNDIIGIALNADDQEVTFYKNGTAQNSGTAISIPTTSQAIFLSLGQGGSDGPDFECNFGQRPYAYTAPSGFKALCTANLPDPTIADGSAEMDIALWTGEGNTNDRTITTSFNPDFVWIKSRSDGTYNHALFDANRGYGTNNVLSSNSTGAEGATDQGYIKSTTNTSMTLGVSGGGNAYYNGGSFTYAAWTWDAGSSTVANTDGSISSSVRANASAGFSIVSYTGNGTSGSTIGHGLGVAPSLFIIKNRTSSSNWPVFYTFGDGSLDILQLAATDAKTDSAQSLPSSTVFTVGGNIDVNASGSNYVAYCWAPVEGYSAFGSYTGTGSATDSPFIWTGFRPRWVLIKRTDTTANWHVRDSARDTYNYANKLLYPNSSQKENAALSNWTDLVSNGFKLRNTNIDFNASGGTYVYAAFAEHSFKYARAR